MHTNILTLSHLPANLRAKTAQATSEFGAKMADVADKALAFPPVWKWTRRTVVAYGAEAARSVDILCGG